MFIIIIIVQIWVNTPKLSPKTLDPIRNVWVTEIDFTVQMSVTCKKVNRMKCEVAVPPSGMNWLEA